MNKLAYFLLVFCLIVVSCSKPKTLLQQLSPKQTGISFENSIFTNDSFNTINYEDIYNGGGVAVGDFNNDGLPDLLFTGNMVSSRLYINKGHMIFEDISETAGLMTDRWCTGACVIDINNDGLDDIYIAVAGYHSADMRNYLFINNGDLSFTESAAAYGLDDPSYSTHAAFLDYDKDGFIDLYLLNSAIETFNRNTIRPRRKDGRGKSNDKLYRNNGDGTFSDVTMEAGILSEGWGLGVTISDLNEDGWPDIYVANDFISNDLLYINNQDGTFSNKIADYLKHQTYNSMGVDIADFNNDGKTDIVVLDMLPEDNYRLKTMIPGINHDRFDLYMREGYEPQYMRNTLQLNRGNGLFSEIGQLAGIFNTDWSWTPLFADFDNDGLKDLLITNGYRKDVTHMDFVSYQKTVAFGSDAERLKNINDALNTLVGALKPNYVYKNNGDYTFSDYTREWGLSKPSYSNGAVYVDLDRDGDLDLVINNIDMPVFIYENVTNTLKEKNHYLQIELIEEKGKYHALHSKVEVYAGHSYQFFENNPYRGYRSSVECIIHAGLGNYDLVDSVCITWPCGMKQKEYNIAANQRLQIQKDQKKLFKPEVRTQKEPWLQEFTKASGVEFTHKASLFDDFKVQNLIPHKISMTGPPLAVADVNGDGLEDLYIGGGAGQGGSLYFQQADGTFRSVVLNESLEICEAAAHFFDANADGFPDLYIVAGGNEFPSGSEKYQDILLLNDGNGNFTHKSSLPAISEPGSCVTSADINGDGHPDLFIGGRLKAWNYPLPGRSYLMVNDGKGNFADVTRQYAPFLENMGMITGAVFTDFDLDGQPDMVITGEWMPPVFLKNQGDHFSDIGKESEISNYKGWWNCVTVHDINNDGLPDFLMGNHGLNNRYKLSAEKPLHLVAKDFDNNGAIDPIMYYHLENDHKAYPLHHRDDLIGQLAGMKKQFISYHKYALSTFEEAFQHEDLSDALKLEVNYLNSACLINQGEGRFSLQSLPIETQFAPVLAILAADINNNGVEELVISGNYYASDPLTGRYNASIGSVLMLSAGTTFDPQPQALSGFVEDRDARSLISLKSADGSILIISGAYGGRIKVFKTQVPSL
jgi:enediyne biosynthesis protein E4